MHFKMGFILCAISGTLSLYKAVYFFMPLFKLRVAISLSNHKIYVYVCQGTIFL